MTDNKFTLVLFGEFAGSNIQTKPTGLAMKEVKKKSFFAFGCQVIRENGPLTEELVHYKFPSIDNYKDWVKQARKSRGLTDTQEDVSQGTEGKVKTLDFSGTVKVHGTNAGLVQRSDGRIYGLGRNKLMMKETGNQFGFGDWYEHKSRNEAITKAFAWIRTNCADEINKAIQQDEKDDEEDKDDGKEEKKDSKKEKPRKWLNMRKLGANIECRELDLYNLSCFPTYSITIEMSPQGMLAAAPKLLELATEVEKECPVGKALGVTGVGEGIVFASNTTEGSSWMSNVFKSKGPLFADTASAPNGDTGGAGTFKSKKGKSMYKGKIADDMKKLEKYLGAKAFVDRTITEVRMEKAVTAIRETLLEHEPISMKELNQFIDWLVADVKKEEADEFKQHKWKSDKDFRQQVGSIAVPYFKKEVVAKEGMTPKKEERDAQLEARVESMVGNRTLTVAADPSATNFRGETSLKLD